VVLDGSLVGDGGAQFLAYFNRHPVDRDMVLDIWGVSDCDSAGQAAIRTARERVEAAGWRFALVGDPKGICALSLADRIPVFSTRRNARAALRFTAAS